MSSSSSRDYRYNFLLDVQGAETIQAAQTKLDAFYQSMQNTGNQLKTYGDNASASFQKIAQGTGSLVTANQQLDTSFNAQKQSIQGVIDSQSRLGQATQQTTQSLIGGKSTIDQSAQSYGILKTAQEQSVQQFGKLQTETVATTSKFEGMKTTIVGLAGGIAAFGASIFSIINGYDSIRRAQTTLEAVSNKYSKAQEAVEKNQRKVNELVLEGKKGTVEYSDALRDLEQANTNYAVISEKQTTAQMRLNETTSSFYLNIVPQVISAGGSMAAIISTASPLWDRLKKSIQDTGTSMGDTSDATGDLTSSIVDSATVTSGGISLWDKFKGALLGTRGATQAAAASAAAASPAFAGMAGAGGGATTAMSGLAAAIPPVAIAIAAIVAVLASVHYNFLGFRDALNTVGKAIGDLFPDLRGLLDLIKGFAGQLGISGEATEEWQAALSRGWEEFGNTLETTLNKAGYIFQNLKSGWDNYVAGIKTQTDNVIAAFTSISTSAAKLGEDIKKGLETGIAIITDPKTYTNAWNGFVTSATTAAKDAWKAIQDEINKVGMLIFGADTWGNLTKGALEAAQNSVKIIQSVLSGVQNWIDEYVTKPAQEAAKSIVEALPKTPEAGTAAQEDTTRGYDAQTLKARANTWEQQGKDVGMVMDKFKTPTLVTELVSSTPPAATSIPRGPKQTGPDMTGLAPKVLNPAVYGPRAGSGQDWERASNAIASVNAAQNNPFAAVNAAIDNLFTKKEGFVDLGKVVVDAFGNMTGASNAAAPAIGEVSGAEAEAALEAAKAEQHQKALAGELGQTARNAAFVEDAVKAQNDVLGVMEAAVHGTAEANAVLNQQIKDGTIIQQSANLGYQNAVKNFLNMQVATAAVSGEVKFLSENLTTVAGVTARTASGFQAGQKAIYDWAGGIDVAKGSADGAMTALENIYQQTGIKLPAGFKKSEQSMKDWYAAMQQAPAEIAKVNAALESGFQKMISGLSDALDEGKSEFKDKIKEMEEELDFRIPKEVRTEWKLEAKTEDLKGDIMLVLEFLKDPNLSQDSAKYFVDNLYSKIGEAVEENPKLAAAANNINALLTEYLNTSDPAAKDAVLLKLVKTIENISATAADAVPYIRDLNKEFGDVRNMENFEKALESINEQLDSLSKKDMSNLKDLNDIDEADAELAAAIEQQRTGMRNLTGLLAGTMGVQTQPNPNAIKGVPRSNESPFAGGGKGAEAESGTAGNVIPVQIDIEGFTAQTEQIITAFTDMMQTLFADAEGIPEGIAAGLAALPELVDPYFSQMQADFLTMAVQPIVQTSQGTLSQGIASGFEMAEPLVGAALVAIRDGAAGTWTLIISDAQGLVAGISSAFQGARSQSQPYISGLSEDFASLAVVPIETMSSGLAETIGSAFEEGERRASAALGGIEESANMARSAVDNLITRLNQIPDLIPVEIRVSVTGDSIPSQLAASGYMGVVSNPVHFTAGEGTEPEFVFVAPLSKMGKGMVGPSSVMAATGWSGVVGAQNNVNIQDDVNTDSNIYYNGSIYTRNNNVNNPPSPSPIDINNDSRGTDTYTHIMDMNIVAVGGSPVGASLPVSVIGGIGTTGGGYSGGGVGGGGGTTGGGTNNQSNIQVDVMEGGVHLYYYARNGVVDTNMSPEQIAKYVGANAPPAGGGGTGAGYTMPAYVKTSGSGARWSGANTDPTGWTSTEMTDPQYAGKWKVVDPAGKNVAAEFMTKEEADAYINAKRGGSAVSPIPTPSASTGYNWPTGSFSLSGGGGGGGFNVPNVDLAAILAASGVRPQQPATTTPAPTTGGGPAQILYDANGRVIGVQTGTQTVMLNGTILQTQLGAGTGAIPVGTNTGFPTGSGTSTQTSTQTSNGYTQTNTQTGGGNQINIQNPNGKFYNYQSSTGVVNTNMTEAEIAQIEAMYPWLAPLPRSSGMGGGIGGFPKGYNPRGWTGPRGTFSQPREDRDNSIPIWDTGPVLYSTDYATYHPPQSLGGGGGGGGGWGGWPWGDFDFGNISKWIENLSHNIMTAVQEALNNVGIQINLNGTKILDSTNNTILRRLNSII